MRDELIAIVEAVAPSVVTVRSADTALVESSGSGWAYAEGIVVTNAHVVAGQDPIHKLRLRGGAVVRATLIGADTLTDLAVLQTDAALPPLPLRKTTPPLGEFCFAFGSPLGDFPESVTFGIVSGLERRLPLPDGRSIERVLQTDAEINSGNSGGPLVDVEGTVLGVNSAIRTDGRGVGFAIPAETVATIVPELLEHREVLRPKLGVAIDVVDHQEGSAARERLRVAAADSRSPLRQGDVLLSVANRPITSRADLFAVLRRPLCGATAPVYVERDGQVVTLEMEFREE